MKNTIKSIIKLGFKPQDIKLILTGTRIATMQADTPTSRK